MTVTKDIKENELIFKLSGGMDSPAAKDFKKMYEDSINENPAVSSIALDCTDLEFVVSAGLHVILEMARDMSEKEGVKMVGMRDEVKDVIKMTGISRYLTID